MARSLLLIVPSLLVGGVAGALLTGAFSTQPPAATKTSVSKGDTGSKKASAPRSARSDSWFSKATSDEIDYERLAQVCAEAAREDREAAAKFGPRVPSTPAEQEEAASNLARVEEQAVSAGVWSRFSGFRARQYLARMPLDEAESFEERLNEQLNRGIMKPEAGAWVPGYGEHESAFQP